MTSKTYENQRYLRLLLHRRGVVNVSFDRFESFSERDDVYLTFYTVWETVALTDDLTLKAQIHFRFETAQEFLYFIEILKLAAMRCKGIKKKKIKVWYTIILPIFSNSVQRWMHRSRNIRANFCGYIYSRL